MHLELTATTLTIALSPFERILAVRLRPTFVLPLAHIVRASTDPPPAGLRIRAPGTAIPFVLQAGTYYGRGREFWYTRPGRPALVIETNQGRYKRFVLSVDDCTGWAERIGRALSDA